MKIIDCVQGTPEWDALHLGRPTCSNFDRILTPKTLKISSQAPTFRNQLLAEWLLGFKMDWGGQSGWMERGIHMEAEARAFYEFKFDLVTETVGFVLRDDEKVGGSPDCLVGEDGGADFKCPAIHTHIGYLLDPSLLVAEYRGQIQGYLYLTGRKWWELVAYSPELPMIVQRVERDEKFITALEAALEWFVSDLEAAKGELTARVAADAGPEPDDAALLTGVPF